MAGGMRAAIAGDFAAHAHIAVGVLDGLACSAAESSETVHSGMLRRGCSFMDLRAVLRSRPSSAAFAACGSMRMKASSSPANARLHRPLYCSSVDVLHPGHVACRRAPPAARCAPSWCRDRRRASASRPARSTPCRRRGSRAIGSPQSWTRPIPTRRARSARADGCARRCAPSARSAPRRPRMRAGAGASTIGSCQTVPVNDSAGMRRDGTVPDRLMSMKRPPPGQFVPVLAGPNTGTARPRRRSARRPCTGGGAPLRRVGAVLHHAPASSHQSAMRGR